MTIQDYSIHPASERRDWQPMLLKHNELFCVLDLHGDIARSDEGLFYRDTRFLSRYELLVDQARLRVLESEISKDNTTLRVQLLCVFDNPTSPNDCIRVNRTIYLWQAVLHERLEITNPGSTAIELSITHRLDVDFADIFEVRGQLEPRKAREPVIVVDDQSISFEYTGRDAVRRSTSIEFDELTSSVSSNAATCELTLAAQAIVLIDVRTVCEESEKLTARCSFDTGLSELKQWVRTKCNNAIQIDTSNADFNRWLRRSFADLYMLTTQTPCGAYPFAGLPWFSAPFGRDGLLTALQTLWMDPPTTRGVLTFLANYQATADSENTDAEPGKILHEARHGELANLGVVPFKRYYGSVDATPLFVLLSGEYFLRTGDKEFIAQIWPHIVSALTWIDEYGDRDDDGFVEYQPRSNRSLINQGWKDSDDALFHHDGTPARGPIALCEVQGYVYAAKRHAAVIADTLGYQQLSTRLRAQAETLRRNFENEFWSDNIGTYVLALDGQKQQCEVRTSNAGQLLFTGIVGPVRAKRVAELLGSNTSHSGWGVRTVADGEARYDPLSYHNGSVWPHDNALIARGLSNYDEKDLVLRIIEGIFRASGFFCDHRLPELFCGFKRSTDAGPIAYPTACAPQAWSAAAAFELLNATLGIRIDATRNRITVRDPRLPTFLEWVKLRGLTIGSNALDIDFHRDNGSVRVVPDTKRGDIEIEITDGAVDE